MNKTLIFTATYNESKNIYKLIERIIKLTDRKIEFVGNLKLSSVSNFKKYV